MIVTANAKINVTLDITGIRDDGFHTLRSVMVPITLSDELSLEQNDRLTFECNIASLCTDDNLCIRAAKAFFDAIGQSPCVSIRLTKRIPFPAGLGGGSSDAAAVLKGLNRLYSNPLSDEKLFSIAATLGSDVPFCLLDKPALCEGRGEILAPLDGLKSMHVVIAIGDGRLSTPAVYREYDANNLPVRDDTDRLLSAIGSDDIYAVASTFGNAFEPVTDILCPETAALRSLLINNGAITAHLSGSGPSVYGIFADAETASNAAKTIQNVGFSAFVCKTVD